MTNYQRSALGVFLILVITFAGTFLLSTWTRNVGRVDTTELGVFSLSDGSKRIIDRLQKPLTIKLFYGKEFADKTGQDQFREINNIYYFVRDLLRAFEQYGGGKLTVEEYDPKPYSDAEEEADRLRLTRLAQGFYFGLAVTNDYGAQEVVPTLIDIDPYRGILPSTWSTAEYKISEAIELAQKPKKKTLGVLSSLDIAGASMDPMMRQMLAMQGQQMPEPWGSIEILRRYYEVTDVAADAAEIPVDVDTLLVVHPKNLSEDTLYAIDQFVMGGGKLIAFVDPYAYVADPAPRDQRNPMGASGHDPSSSLNRLLNAYGAHVPKDKVAADRNLMQSMAGGPRGGTPVVAYLDFKAQGDAGINPDEPIARGLTQDSLPAFLPGVVEISADKPADVEFVPILRTTPEGAALTFNPSELSGFMGFDPSRLNDKYAPGASPVVVAARLTGVLKSAFPDGAPKSDEAPDDGDEPEEEVEAADPDKEPGDADAEPAEVDDHRAATAEPNTVVVVADVDMMADALSFRRFANLLMPVTANPDFLVNAVDYIAGSTDLMSIRSRGTPNRQFDVVEEIRREAQVQTEDKARQIQADIDRFQQELNDLQSQATEQNVGVLRGEAMEKQREVERKIREKERELKDVRRAETERIEALDARLQVLNILGVPIVVLLIGLGLAWNQRRKRALTVTGGAG